MSIGSDTTFINNLKKRLMHPLPGPEAHWLMAASHRGKKTFDFNFNSAPVLSSVLIMLFRQSNDFYFPLIQRPEYGGVHSGQIGLPGGKKEDHDKDRIATALRETDEEIGIGAERIKILGNLSELYVQASNINVLPVVGYLNEIPGYHPDPAEVSDVIECKVSLLLREETKREKEIIIRNNIRVWAPYFAIENRMVWGATAMILSEFITILKEIY
jgi:8-oxo-dGTP pyrophosphatase MutT (NUDIX family)